MGASGPSKILFGAGAWTTMLSVALLGGCASSYPVERVQADATQERGTQKPGIYYHLPKTVFDLSLLVKLTETKGGRLAGIEAWYDDYDPFACKHPPKTCDFPLKPATSAEVIFEKVEPQPESFADPTQRFVVQPDLSFWIKQSHTLKFEPTRGWLTGVEASMSNEGLKTAVTAVTTAASLARLAQTKGYLAMSEKDTAANICEPRPDVAASDEMRKAKSVIDLVRSDPEKPDAPKHLTYGDAKLVVQDVTALREHARYKKCEALTALVNAARAGNSEATGQLLRDEYRRIEAEIDAKLQKTLIDWQVVPRSVVPTSTSLRLAYKLEPALDSDKQAQVKGVKWLAFGRPVHQAGDETAQERPASCVWTTVSDGRDEPGDWCVLDKTAFVAMASAPSEGVAERALKAFYSGKGLALRMRPLAKLPSADATIGDAMLMREQDNTLGYRYRLPALALLQVAAVKPCPTGKACRYEMTHRLVESIQPVAQFGRIASLPVKFWGSNTKLEFALDPHGFLHSVTLGQDAQSIEPVTQAVEQARAARTQRETARAKAAAEATSAPLDAVKQANDLLAEQLRQRRLQACLAAAEKLPAGAAFPAECAQ